MAERIFCLFIIIFCFRIILGNVNEALENKCGCFVKFHKSQIIFLKFLQICYYSNETCYP